MRLTLKITSFRRSAAAFVAAGLGLLPAWAASAAPSVQPADVTQGQGGAVGLPMPLSGVYSPQQLIGLIIKSALGLIGVIALVMFIYGGFTWMTAQGNEEKVKEAKNTLVWATIGLIAVFSSYAIANFIINTVLEQNF